MNSDPYTAVNSKKKTSKKIFFHFHKNVILKYCYFVYDWFSKNSWANMKKCLRSHFNPSLVCLLGSFVMSRHNPVLHFSVDCPKENFWCSRYVIMLSNVSFPLNCVDSSLKYIANHLGKKKYIANQELVDERGCWLREIVNNVVPFPRVILIEAS